MTVIAFRPRSARKPEQPARTDHPTVHGTFRSPRGGSGVMTGSLRVRRLVLVPRGAFVSGVFTGELRDDDGTLIGVESRRATAACDLVQDAHGFQPWVRPFALDLMGITVDVGAFAIDPAVVFPRLDPVTRRPRAVAPVPDTGPAS
jgi:hypothetical protein